MRYHAENKRSEIAISNQSRFCGPHLITFNDSSDALQSEARQLDMSKMKILLNTDSHDTEDQLLQKDIMKREMAPKAS